MKTDSRSVVGRTMQASQVRHEWAASQSSCILFPCIDDGGTDDCPIVANTIDFISTAGSSTRFSHVTPSMRDFSTLYLFRQIFCHLLLSSQITVGLSSTRLELSSFIDHSQRALLVLAMMPFLSCLDDIVGDMEEHKSLSSWALHYESNSSESASQNAERR